MPLYCHPVVHSFCSINLVLHHFTYVLFVYRLLRSSLWCICVYAHTIHYFRLGCWCFILLLHDKQVLSACLWFVRKCILLFMFHALPVHNSFNSFSAVRRMLFCRMVARYAPPISYNFLNLIRLGGNVKTTFEKVIAWQYVHVTYTMCFCFAKAIVVDILRENARQLFSLIHMLIVHHMNKT
jgi:hypothetical protein